MIGESPKPVSACLVKMCLLILISAAVSALIGTIFGFYSFGYFGNNISYMQELDFKILSGVVIMISVLSGLVLSYKRLFDFGCYAEIDKISKEKPVSIIPFVWFLLDILLIVLFTKIGIYYSFFPADFYFHAPMIAVSVFLGYMFLIFFAKKFL